MINLRLSALNDNSFGEPEQDANSAMIELDKGIRSSKIGEQCQAIVKFPKLFEKYPFPILINSAFLKLAEVFRVGTNFLRVWVLRVCQQSDKHLDKILNVEEFVRRIYSVMYSNDPIAKALTLRTLGSVARIIPERKQVHHSIRRSLDSHDLVEVEAAIYAAQMFAAQSKLFAIFLCSKISSMIRGQTTPASMKLQLIPILQYMHHDISTAAMANELCIELLKSYPAAEFVKVTLSASTTLASATLIDVPIQVLLLLRYLLEEPRMQLKSHALNLLHSLAKKGAHLWPQQALDQLIDNTIGLLDNTADNSSLIIRTLDVIDVLTQSPVTCDANVSEKSPLFNLCSKGCYSSDPIVAVKSVMILTKIACYCCEENLPVNGITDIVTSLESLITLLTIDDKNLYQLKACLSMTVKLCKVNPANCSIFVNVIGSTLVNVINNKQNNQHAIVLCEALGAIGNFEENILLPLLPDILTLLKETKHSHTKVMLCTLIFQMIAADFEWNTDCLEAIDVTVKSVENWDRYRIARSATRYGHHQIAKNLFGVLKEGVALEHFHFWLLSLQQLTMAESFLMEDEGGAKKTSKSLPVKKLSNAVSGYYKACATLRAAYTHTSPLQFSHDYAKLRYEFLQALVQLLHNCRSLCTSPPYAIASVQAQNAKDELQRFGRVTTQLRKSVQEFCACAENYQTLYQSAFDADNDSLNNIKALRELCLLMAYSVQRVCGGPTVPVNYSSNVSFNFGCTVEMKQLSKYCTQIRNLVPLGETDNEASNQKTGGISHFRVNNLISQIRYLTSKNVRLPIPRYFFQILQTTNIKLAVLPTPRVPGECISLSQGTQLALRVEGVVTHGKKKTPFRSVAAINVILSTIASKTSSDKKETPLSEMEQTVIPQRDFFSCEFLLPLGSQNSNVCGNTQPNSGGGGQYQVIVSANIIDESDNTWKSEPKSIVPVKVHEEPAKRKVP